MTVPRASLAGLSQLASSGFCGTPGPKVVALLGKHNGEWAAFRLLSFLPNAPLNCGSDKYFHDALIRYLYAFPRM